MKARASHGPQTRASGRCLVGFRAGCKPFTPTRGQEGGEWRGTEEGGDGWRREGTGQKRMGSPACLQREVKHGEDGRGTGMTNNERRGDGEEEGEQKVEQIR